MKRKFKIVLTIMMFLIGFKSGIAQNSQGKTDDFARISLTPVVVDQVEGLPPSAFGLLENKMQQMVTKNGLGANSLAPRFIITVNLAVITKDVLPGPPAMIAMNIDATFYIADYQSKTVFSTKTVSFKAVGTNANKAYIDGIKTIRPDSPEFASFIEDGKNKIIAYYNDRCDFILQDAKSLTSQKQYQEAIYQLSLVPDVCKDCYMKASNATGPIFKAYMDDLCNRNLAAAKAVWVANPNSFGANEISSLFADILPDAACYGEAQKLVKQVSAKVLADEKRDWNFQMKQWNDGVSLESQRIKATRDVGVAYGNNQPSTVYHIKGWLW